MNKYLNRLKNQTKRCFRTKITETDIQGYKIIIGHIINNNSVADSDPLLNRYVVSNPLSHYDLILTPTKALLVNTKDIINIEVNDKVLEKVITRVKIIISTNTTKKIDRIFDRKYNILDKILENVKK